MNFSSDKLQNLYIITLITAIISIFVIDFVQTKATTNNSISLKEKSPILDEEIEAYIPSEEVIVVEPEEIDESDDYEYDEDIDSDYNDSDDESEDDEVITPPTKPDNNSGSNNGSGNDSESGGNSGSGGDSGSGSESESSSNGSLSETN